MHAKLSGFGLQVRPCSDWTAERSVTLDTVLAVNSANVPTFACVRPTVIIWLSAMAASVA
jgi:hypothetical protein